MIDWNLPPRLAYIILNKLRGGVSAGGKDREEGKGSIVCKPFM